MRSIPRTGVQGQGLTFSEKRLPRDGNSKGQSPAESIAGPFKLDKLESEHSAIALPTQGLSNALHFNLGSTWFIHISLLVLNLALGTKANRLLHAFQSKGFVLSIWAL